MVWAHVVIPGKEVALGYAKHHQNIYYNEIRQEVKIAEKQTTARENEAESKALSICYYT